MIQLVFISAASVVITPELASNICREAAANNRRDEISGILIARNQRFLQVMEGPQVVVEDAFLRMIHDDRHHNLKVLSRRKTAKREFGEWDLHHVSSLDDYIKEIDKLALLVDSASPELKSEFSALCA